MKPKEWFEVGQRLIAVYVSVLGFQNLINFLHFILYWSKRSYSAEGNMAFLAYAIGYFVLAVILFASAPAIARFAYPENSQDATDDKEKPD